MSALPLAVQIQFEAAQRLGYECRVLDPEYSYLFEIVGRGRRRVLLGGRSAINDAMAARLAEDKFYTGLLLANAGVRVPESVRCLSPHHFKLEQYADRAGAGPGIAFAEQRGFPLVVKPNRLSHGRGVAIVHDAGALVTAIESVWQLDSLALVQNLVPGDDYRLNFLAGDFLVGYKRSRLIVTGDGRSSLRELIAAVDPRYADDRTWQRLTESATWQQQVASIGQDEQTVLPETTELSLGDDILNLAGVATSELIREVPARWVSFAARIADVLGLVHFGIDLKCASLAESPDAATVIEVNASPLLSQIYRMGHTDVAVACQVRVLEHLMA